MDLLQKELKRKKESLSKAKAEAEGGRKGHAGGVKRKYLKIADLRRIEEEEREEKERKRWRKRQQKKQPKSGSASNSNSTRSSSSVSVSVSADGSSWDHRGECDPARTQSSIAAAAATKKKTTTTSGTSDSDAKDPSPSSSLPKSSKEEKSDLLDASPASVTQRLRQMGLVVRYFGEGNSERSERLKEALVRQSKTLEGLSELEEFRLGKGHGIRNPFLAQNKELEKQQGKKNQGGGFGDEISSGKKARLGLETTEPPPQKNDEGGTGREPEGDNNEEEEDDSDPPKIIYKYLKGLLKEWERELAGRPESVARSVAGRNESKTLKQCKDYVRPLFKLLKARKIEDGLQFHLLKIVNFAKRGEFVQAHDSYIDVAIGRAAWPIGVTMVGIHARSGRAKIESSNVAHVMNSELQRKYLTSVKRLLTYDQKRRDDVDPSKKVG